MRSPRAIRSASSPSAMEAAYFEPSMRGVVSADRIASLSLARTMLHVLREARSCQNDMLINALMVSEREKRDGGSMPARGASREGVMHHSRCASARL